VSFLTGTQSEIIYDYVATSTQLNTFTTEDNLQKTYPPVIIPAGFFLNPSQQFKALRLHAQGRLGTTSAPTFTWSIRLLTSTTWSAAGILLGSTAALTGGTTKTLAVWEMDAEITLKTLSIGGASTVACLGKVSGPTALASPFAGTIPTDNTAFTVTTVDNSVTYYLFVSVACGTSNGANLIQMETIKLYGEN
jgi:hypothetical protein